MNEFTHEDAKRSQLLFLVDGLDQFLVDGLNHNVDYPIKELEHPLTEFVKGLNGEDAETLFEYAIGLQDKGLEQEQVAAFFETVADYQGAEVMMPLAGVLYGQITDDLVMPEAAPIFLRVMGRILGNPQVAGKLQMLDGYEQGRDALLAVARHTLDLDATTIAGTVLADAAENGTLDNIAGQLVFLAEQKHPEPVVQVANEYLAKM
ncbi:hypothetical protein ACFL1B_01445 [Nanoarchaeota archaeon]